MLSNVTGISYLGHFCWGALHLQYHDSDALLESLVGERINDIGRYCPFLFLFKFKERLFKLKYLSGAILRTEGANQMLVKKIINQLAVTD